jgi:restriction system protein
MSLRGLAMSERVTFQSVCLSSIKAGELRAKLSAAGDRILRYYIDFRHEELGLHKELSAPEISILQNKVDTLMLQWDAKYRAFLERQQLAAGKELAEDMANDAEAHRARLRNTLRHTLSIDDTVDWEVLKDHTKFNPPIFPRQKPKPKLKKAAPPPLAVSFFQALTGQRRKLTERHEAAIAEYNEEIKRIELENAKALAEWDKERDEWNAKQDAERSEFLEKQRRENEKVDRLKDAWRSGDPTAVEEHAAIVLESSDHDEVIPKSWDLAYDPETKTIIVDYDLPTPDDLPTLKTVRYVKSTGELKETRISAKEQKDLYDELCFQICLRTVHELFEADTFDHLERIVFNGQAEYIDKATGQRVRSTIISLMTTKPEFSAVNLAAVEPRACFKSLKGVSAASLVGLTPVAPIMQFDKEDKRFVDAQDVVLSEDGATNLAAMNWEEFEHLVRDIFDKEFASRGGEVRVTQSSSDGGVDAIGFDPDPISGGKVVIQAKRYTKTVGVNAVRDLYGTTLNEGAIKGILVTTSDFGPDAHKLLHLLEKHGVKAKIDLMAARKELGLKG